MLRTVSSERSSDPGSSAGIGGGLVLLLAVACGAAAANLYYAQPLLHTLGRVLGVSEGTAGLLITVTQIGYVLGLSLLVPLGDLLERRRMITVTLALTALALVAAALAPSFAVFAVAVGVAGVSSAIAQVIVPLSSSLAAEHERGRVVGTVMSGLLIGILVARTVSGLLAAALGWRAVFWVAAGVMLVLATVLRRALSEVPPATEMSYRGLLRSVLTLVREEPVLRLRMLIGALGFGCFSALWTSLAFLLAGPPYNYGNAVIGLFGLAGLAGAGAATVVGRLADRGHGARATSIAGILLLLSWGVLEAGRTAVIALLAGIVLLDLGVQGAHISNQSAIYALRPEARSRLTTAYMVACFLGGAALSALSSSMYGSSGWSGVCVLGAVSSGLLLVIWVASRLAGRVRNRGATRRPLAEGAGGSD
jgi:predicted MFS family arabinose efflux permease